MCIVDSLDHYDVFCVLSVAYKFLRLRSSMCDLFRVQYSLKLEYQTTK